MSDEAQAPHDVPAPVTLDAPPGEAQTAAWHAVRAAAHAHDLPGTPGPSPVETAGKLRVPPARGRDLCVAVPARTGPADAAGAAGEGEGVGEDGGAATEYAGVAALVLFNDPGNTHTAYLDTLTVHPAARGRGTGTALWERLRAELVEEGRTSVSALIDLGGPGERFARSLGFENVLPMGWYVQTLGPEPAPEPELPEGYRLVAWRGIVPDEHAVATAVAHAAMEDAPDGALDSRTPLWDAERLRAAERLVLDRGGRILTVAAVTAAGDVAAYTELVLTDPAAVRAIQYDTVVVPGHRGRGLGRAVKLAMLAQLRELHPDVREIGTSVADENGPMRAVNEALGYRLERPCGYFQLALDAKD
ncbi:GNAT family N-acetyltransferase [Streptomyces sp. NPDC097619]|uniref:GNAT family N-acetyltransferase n=1 Tax=Streptomyces sp. NPDC097619 TaxID=3157228 RepID=UPI0033187084